MFQISARGPRAEIETAWEALAWADPTPAGAVDAKEDGRTHWRLDAYAETEADAQMAVAIIALAAPDLQARYQPLPERDWVRLSLEGLPPVEAGKFIVAGSHALANSSPGKIGVLIEAGPAFGTGHHGTTLGCLMALDQLRRARRIGRVLDLGTGSGVLAIAALKAGARDAWGSDNDFESVVVARENAKKNGVARFRPIYTTGARHTEIRRAAPFDTVFANILARPLVSLSHDIEALTRSGGTIILSGLLNHQEPQVRRAYAGQRLSLINRIRRDGWSTLVYRKA